MPRSVHQLVRSQILLREVNERILQVVNDSEETMEFLCECSQEGCIESIPLARAEYERIRSHSNLFLVTPGHETTAVERVVDQGGSYLLVEKTVGVEEVEANDPRSGTA